MDLLNTFLTADQLNSMPTLDEHFSYHSDDDWAGFLLKHEENYGYQLWFNPVTRAVRFKYYDEICYEDDNGNMDCTDFWNPEPIVADRDYIAKETP